MDILRIALAWLLVWALGIALVRLLYARRGDWPMPHPAWVGGVGFLLGAFVLTLLMSAVSHAGGSFDRLTIGLPMLLVTIGLWIVDVRRQGGPRNVATAMSARWRALVARPAMPSLGWLALLAWLVVRSALLLGEVLRQPLFPWDAWTQWATKARVWFALRHMVPFEPAQQWLTGTAAYFDAAPHYPATVPLWQVWSSVALGRFDDALMNLPWWLLGVALTLLLYGFLRDRKASPLFALAATWMIVSMPILETHVALAGYADLPMACYLTAAALAGLRALQALSLTSGSPTVVRKDDAIVALMLIAALPTIKNPGWIWMMTLLPGLLVAWLPRHGMRIVVAGLAIGVALLFLLGRYEPVILGYHLHFQLDVPWHGLVEAYLSFDNWHLLFWVLPVIVVATRHWLVDRELAPLTAVVGSGALFLLLGFSITSAAVWVEDQSTVNRATLHLAPLIGVWLVLLVRRALESGAPALQEHAHREDAETALPVTAPAVAVAADGRDA